MGGEEFALNLFEVTKSRPIMEQSLPFRREIRRRPIVLVLCWFVGILAPLSAEMGHASCGDYVHFRHGEMRGHRLATSLVPIAGSPFGRSAESHSHRNRLGVRAVLMLETERTAQQARLAGYESVPDHPETPCQGPACGGQSKSTEPPLPSTSDSSSQDRWVMATSESNFLHGTRRANCQELPGVRLVGDWPEIDRPPNLSVWVPRFPSRLRPAV